MDRQPSASQRDNRAPGGWHQAGRALPPGPAAAAVRRPRLGRPKPWLAALLVLAALTATAADGPLISEFMAANDTSLADADGEYSDWIELHNPTGATVDLAGWSLTDDAGNLQKWRFPACPLEPGGFRLVFASGKDRRDPAGDLHTNFRLDADGEYLALVRPDGSVALAFSPAYPRQFADAPYGLPFAVTGLVTDGTPAAACVPTGTGNLRDSAGHAWYSPAFAPGAGWQEAELAVGFGLTRPGFRVRMLDVDGGDDGYLDSTGEAEAVLAGLAAPSDYRIVTDVTTVVPVIDFAGDWGTFPVNQPYPDGTNSSVLEDIALCATARVTIPVGEWTIGFGSDDGGRLRLAGVAFANESNTVGDTPGDDEIRFEAPRAHDWTAGQLTVVGQPLTTTLEAMFFERGGGDSWEIAIRPGLGDAWYAAGGALLGDGVMGWSVTTPDEAGVRTDLEAAMRGSNATALLQVPFTVATTAEGGGLGLAMFYNDGFVAYLNGEEVARRNAPEALAWNSTATAARTLAETATAEGLNLTAWRGLLRRGRNLLAIHGLNTAADDATFLLRPVLAAFRLSGTTPTYLGQPTPGGPNSATGQGHAADPEFSVDHGLYTKPQRVTITTATPNAAVRYTLDGSEPSADSGTAYSGPLTVSTTTVLRARAFRADLLPSTTITRTYLFPADVGGQTPEQAWAAGWPAWSETGQYLDYGMDPEIVTNPTWGAQLQGALTSLPSLCLAVAQADLTDPAAGIYVNPYQHGMAWERPVSVELLEPDGGSGLQIDAGLRLRGGYSRSTDNPKHAFRLFFRDTYGHGLLSYPLFEREGVSTFDAIDLRTTQNYSWAFDGSDRNTFLRDVFSRDTQGAMGQPYPRSRYYHLYLNGLYWGLYQTEERPEAGYAVAYFGGAKEEYDVVKAAGPTGGYGIEATDGNLDAWYRLWLEAKAGLADAERYYRVQGCNPDGTPNPLYERLVDVDNLVDYMLINYYTGDRDGPATRFVWPATNNFFAIYNRVRPDGFKFFEHDSEHSLDTGEYDLVNPRSVGGAEFGYFNPHWLHEQLTANPDYVMRLADRVCRAFGAGGVLADAAVLARLDRRAAEIATAMVAESARWGDARVEPPYTQATWTTAVGWVKDWVPGRRQVVLEQFRGQGWYPPLDPPGIAVGGVAVPPGGAARAGPDDRVTVRSLTSDTAATVLVATGATWRYLDDGSDQGRDWRQPGFADGSWAAGPAQLGYGDGDEATVLSPGPDPEARAMTCYFRHEFEAAGPADVTALTLRLLCDDGAVVYLNGSEVARRNLPEGDIAWDTLATAVVGGDDESAFTELALDPTALVAGRNLLAVEVHQCSPASSDLSLDLELVARAPAPGWGTVYATLDGSDPRLPGGAVAPAATAWPTAGLTLSGRGHLAARTLADGVWSPLTDAWLLGEAPAAAGNLTISELQYHPHAPTAAELALAPGLRTDDFEFVELANVGQEPIDLAGLRFTAGVDFALSVATALVLAPGQAVVVVRNRAAFVLRYGNEAVIAGEFAVGGLADGGETVSVADVAGNPIVSVTYDDSGTWPQRADGQGSSLELAVPTADPTVAGNWYASTAYGGTPGVLPTATAADVVVNEVLSRPAAQAAVELRNLAAAPVAVGGWYLSDTASTWQRFRVPAGTSIPAGGYAVLRANRLEVVSGPAAFAFDGAHGGEVWLLATDAAGRPTRFVDHVSFGAAAAGESWGRASDGGAGPYPLRPPTLGAANPAPRVGPLAISEIMYRPIEMEDGFAVDDAEYLEVRNPTADTVGLSGWRLHGGVDFDFPDGLRLAPTANLVVLGFDPAAPANAERLAAVLRRYALTGQNVSLVGGYRGHLADTGETVELQRPDAPPAGEPDFVPWLQVDRVAYASTPPWPSTPAGGGDTLVRARLDGVGDRPEHWAAAPPTPGQYRLTTNDEFELLEDAGPTRLPVLANDPGAGQGLTVLVFSAPDRGGTVRRTPDGALLYTPAASFAGVETFTYTAVSRSGLTERATVRVSVTAVDDPPTVTRFTVRPAAGGAPGFTASGDLAVDLQAEDVDGDVTAWAITETDAPPPAADARWQETPPLWYSLPTPPPATVVLHAWARDAAGGVSLPAAAASCAVHVGTGDVFCLRTGSAGELVFGHWQGATAGFDAGLDALAPDVPAGVAHACWVSPATDPNGLQLATDVRAPGVLSRWRLTVTPAAEPLTVTWDAARVPAAMALVLQRLRDEWAVGAPTDLAQEGGVAVAEGAAFEVAFGQAQTVTGELLPGWNLVGTPLLPLPAAPARCGRDRPTGVGTPWFWQAGAYCQIGDDPWLPERGYFVFCSEDGAEWAVQGLPADGLIRLSPGWNLVSPVADWSLPADAPGIVYPAWSWDAATQAYRPLTAGERLRAGTGYWLYCRTALSLTTGP